MTKPHDSLITEDTRVKVRLSSAWAIIVSIFASAIWLTSVVIRIQYENKQEHAAMISSIERISENSEHWITKAELEDTLAYIIAEAHRGMSNISIRERELRQGVRERLAAPKTVQ